ncbi:MULTISPECIES: CNNM domain-containing protein [Flavobacterium]|uniref:CNNM domain-containing protein n=1 Tax=Flavobacterium jumunjinense TaxID=998845 RepID=A0ABV5GQZ4_9FLAO|nr:MULTISPECIES: CNNM domain-containing protein [Flavobacterium]
MTLLIIYAVTSIFFSFLCSILEAVLLSVTHTFITISKKEGKAFAPKLEAIKADIDKPLITILTLNTIAHTVGAILVGVQAEKTFGNGNNAVAIVSSIMTFLILILSEIIPKTIGAKYWKELASFTTSTLQLLIFPLKITGILWLLQLTTKLIGGTGHTSILSRDDFSAMADIAEKEGVFKESESKVLKNLLSLGSVFAKDIMTPRTVVKIADSAMSIETFYEANRKLRFSRIPIYTTSSDNIIGLVLKTDILDAMINNKGNESLESIKRSIVFTKRNKPIPQLFEELIQNKNHMSAVLDEYGSFSGLVTQEDVIETLLGLEIMDESDSVEDLQKLAKRNLEKRIEELKKSDN